MSELRKRAGVTSRDDDEGEPATHDDVLILGEEERRVVTLIRSLPPKRRVVFVAYYEGLTFEEIPRLVDKPVATVRSLLRHARNQLKEELGL